MMLLRTYHSHLLVMQREQAVVLENPHGMQFHPSEDKWFDNQGF